MIWVTKTFCLTLISCETYFRSQFAKENPSTLEIWVSSSTSASHVNKRKREVISSCGSCCKPARFRTDPYRNLLPR